MFTFTSGEADVEGVGGKWHPCPEPISPRRVALGIEFPFPTKMHRHRRAVKLEHMPMPAAATRLHGEGCLSRSCSYKKGGATLIDITGFAVPA